MDPKCFLLVISTLVQQVLVEVVPHETSFAAVVEMVSGDSRIFSGEGFQLRCSVPDEHNSKWTYLWFKDADQLPQSEQKLDWWKARVRDSGKFYCQGVRDTVVGKIHTLKSLPMEIIVDGGWAFLQVPNPGFVKETLKLTCRIRGNLPLHEVILYKDGVEIMKQEGRNPHFYLNNLTLEDQGMYSCRVSWDKDRRTHSANSVDAPVKVLEHLSEPILEIVVDNNPRAKNMKLICHVQYNVPAPAPPVSYYFYKDGVKMGTALSENHTLVRRTPGQYSCKARVAQLGLIAWSEPKALGR
ncbi:low affinity immunoglobulin gamma Fc region receptor III-B-like isoform X2 [Solea senegalensis]|uniref:uncharacterized protein LOC122773655 isoform X1 n=1 Tax=Solea senegalensis TaxID=28829 RepID=UPI001C41D16D|nr:uncharacterized protein LOC122773655 isoform X1 [Solea senegalensis]KAG7478645.1 low affinity immunoglobulin gamma Fc region receptor III-B-like isoform X2 [Solea senegalensis]